MKQKLLLFIMAIMMIPVVGMAQPVKNKVPAEVKKAMLAMKATKMGPADKHKSLALQSPYIPKALTTHHYMDAPFAKALKSPKLSKAMQQKSNVQIPFRAASATVAPQGYVAYSKTDGLAGSFYDLTLSGKDFSKIAESGIFQPSAGGVIIDDTYYSFFVDDTYASWFGVYFYYLVGWNAETYEVDETQRQQLYNTYENFVLSVAKTSDDKLFVQTYDSEGKNLEFATFTLDNSGESVVATRTKVCDAAHYVLCMTNTKAGVIYAIAEDNALYTIDPTTGAMTKIGDTGFTAYDATDGGYGQSMCYDDKGGKLYWYAVASDGSSTPIFEVNPATGAATKISVDDADFAQIYGAVIPAPKAEDGAPAAITDFNADPNVVDGGTMKAYATFTAPSTTYAGDELTGELTYDIYVNGVSVSTGTCTAGEAVDRIIDLEHGNNTVYVTTTNAVGVSPKSNRVSFWAGDDTPYTPDNVNLEIDDEGNATLTWDPVEECEHGGDASNITYKIMEADDETVVAENISGTEYKWTVTLGQLKAYSYHVYAVNGSEVSEDYGGSNIVVKGNPLEIPVAWGTGEDGVTEEEAALFTMVDANDDWSTWSYETYGGYFEYCYSSDNDGDDWLFTPKMNVKAGKTYVVKYVAKETSEWYPEKLEVKVGNDATVEAMTTTVVEGYEPPSEKVVSEFEYTATEDGVLVIGFHAISPADAAFINLYSVSVEYGAEQGAPAAATDLTVTPGEKGAMSATVAFTTPSKSVKGDAIETLTKVEISRNDTLISTMENVEAGKAITYNDEVVPESGVNTYKVVAYNECGFGKKATASAFIGCDVPANVENAQLTDQKTSIKVDWEKVGEKGANGGYVDPSQVYYSIYSIDEYGYVADQVFTDEDVNTAMIEDVNTDEGDPGLMQYAFQTSNEVGEGDYTTTTAIVKGAIADAPMTETFAGGEIQNYWWVARTGNGGWGLSNYEDGYATFSQAEAGDTGWLGTQKLSVKNIATPGVVLEAKMTKGATLSIIATLRNGDEVNLGTVNGTAESQDDAQWESHLFLIPENLKNEDFVVICIQGEATEDAPTLFVKNFMVRDIIDDDLSLSITAPEKVTKGKAIIGHVTVTNEGKNSASNYTVKVTCGNEVLSEQTFTETLAPYATRMVNFGTLASLFNDDETATISATVTYSKDLNPDNDYDEVEVALEEPTATPINGLNAENTADGVVLTWNAADKSASTVTEDFESYDNEYAFPYTYNEAQVEYFTDWNKVGTMGPWTAYDLDGGSIYGWSSSAINFNLMGDAMGFVNLDAQSVFGEEDAVVYTHGGDKALFCMNIAPASDDDAPQQNDDWLVSPALTGNAQTLSFWAREITENYGAETFEILYSTTDMETESFIKLEDGTIESEEFTEYSYQLPEGAKYFAIRVTSADVFGSIFDDITYETWGDAPESFNIYRDGKKVDNTEAKTYTYTENEEGTHTYSVTAVYANGNESVPQSVTLDVTTGINSVDAAGQNIIFNLGGVKLNDAQHGVNIVNGKATVVK